MFYNHPHNAEECCLLSKHDFSCWQFLSNIYSGCKRCFSKYFPGTASSHFFPEIELICLTIFNRFANQYSTFVLTARAQNMLGKYLVLIGLGTKRVHSPQELGEPHKEQDKKASDSYIAVEVTTIFDLKVRLSIREGKQPRNLCKIIPSQGLTAEAKINWQKCQQIKQKFIK